VPARFDAVYNAKLDGSPEASATSTSCLTTFRKYGVALVSVSESLDTSTAGGWYREATDGNAVVLVTSRGLELLECGPKLVDEGGPPFCNRRFDAT